jgi:hypothetical protein
MAANGTASRTSTGDIGGTQASAESGHASAAATPISRSPTDTTERLATGGA